MRKTAHVSFLVEFDDEITPLDAVVSYNQGGVLLHRGAKIINTPELTVHTGPIRVLSHNEYIEVITAMGARGGGFVRALGQALLKADSHNSAKLTDTFWNLINAYRPVHEAVVA